MIPIDSLNQVNTQSASKSSLQSLNFKEWELKIKDQIDHELYTESLEECQQMEAAARELKSNQWLNKSYFYAGICCKSLNDLPKAIDYFTKISFDKENPFDGDNEKVFQLFRHTAGAYKGLNNYPEAIAYCKKSLEWADEVKNLETIISIYVNMGIMNSTLNHYVEAKECYQKGLELINRSDDYMSSIIYNNLGNDEYTQGNYAKAVEYYIQSIKLSDKTNDLSMLAYSYNNLGNIYFNGIKNLDKAFEYYSKSLEIEKKTGNKEGIAHELNNIGNIYTLKQKYAESEKSYFEALTIFRSLKNSAGISTSLESLGVLYSKTSRYDKAIVTLRESVEYSTQKNESKRSASTFNSIGALYYYKKDYTEALNYYFKALTLAQTNDDKTLTKQALSGIHEAYAQMGQYDKAYKYYQSYSTIKDTLLNSDISKQIIDIQEKYEKSKMEQRVQLQNLEIKNKSIQRNWILTFLILSIFVFSGIVYFVFQKRKTERILFDRNAKIKDNEIKNLIKDSEIKSMASMAEGQENERQRISRELHDRVGSMLSLIKLNLSASNDDNNPVLEENLALLDQTYQEVRNISHNLYSGLLRTFGLKVALQNLKKTIETHNAIRFDLYFHDEDILFPKEVDEVIYRVIQELITNTLKHAEATCIDVQLNCEDNDTAIISVEDNGRGFNPHQKNSEGIGLSNIRYRLSSLGGSLEINSSPGNGAFFLLTIPIKN